MVTYHGIFTVKPGQRDRYVEEIRASKLVEAFRKQHGCIFYEVSKSVLEENDIVVSDAWETEEDYRAHVDSRAVADWHAIYHRYVVNCVEHEYHFEPEGVRNI